MLPPTPCTTTQKSIYYQYMLYRKTARSALPQGGASVRHRCVPLSLFFWCAKSIPGLCARPKRIVKRLKGGASVRHRRVLRPQHAISKEHITANTYSERVYTNVMRHTHRLSAFTALYRVLGRGHARQGVPGKSVSRMRPFPHSRQTSKQYA